METKVADVTVSVTAGEVTPLNDAVICDAPVAALVAKPFEGAALLTVAADPVTCHVTAAVRFWVVLFE